MSVQGDPPQQPNVGQHNPNDEHDTTMPRRLGNSTFQDIIDSEGPPAIPYEQFINNAFLREKFDDEEVRTMFSAIEEDPAVIPKFKDNHKFLEVVRYIGDLFAPFANDPAMLQQQGGNMEAANLMNLFGGQGQDGDPMANLNQLIQDQGVNPMENMGQMADLAQLFGGQGGNPMANFNQLLQGQDGNPVQNMQGQGRNLMDNLFPLMGVQGVNQMENVNQGQVQEQNPMANLAQMLGGNPMENMQGQAGNPMANILQLLGGQHGNPMENMNQGQEQNPMANLAQMLGGNPMENMQGQAGNPMANILQLFGGQHGNPMENMNQGQEQNPMANLAHQFGGQGQGDVQGNQDQLAYLQEYLNMM